MRRLIAQLDGFPALLRRTLDDVPRAALDFAPQSWKEIPSEALTIRAQLCHLRDIEIDGYAKRFERVRDEDRPFLPSIDGMALARERRYESEDADAAIEAFAAARRKNVRLLSGFDAAELDRRAEFEGAGEATLRSLAHFLSSHDCQHLAGIEWLLAKYAAQ